MIPKPAASMRADDESTQAIEDLIARVRRGLIAAYGIEAGTEAAADAAVWAWEHRNRLVTMKNPAGYLYRVGQSASRRHRRRATFELPEIADDADSLVIDPRLPDALAALTTRQRAAVLLVHAHGYGLTETAAVLGISVSSVRNHLNRGVARLRELLGDDHD